MAARPLDPLDAELNAWEQPVTDTGMTRDEIVGVLREQERAATTFRDTTLAGEQAAAIDFYEAEPFGDEVPDRSQVVVPDVAEVCDYTLVSLLRTVTSGDRVVEFSPGDVHGPPDLPELPCEPQVPDGQQPDPQAMQAYQQAKAQYDAIMAEVRDWEDAQDKAAQDATEAVNHIFLRGQNGYRVLVDWLQSGIVEKIGVIKTACVEQRRKLPSQASIVSAETLAALQMDGSDIGDVTDNGDGSYTVRPRQYAISKRYLDLPVPSEEFLFAPMTRDEEDAPYLAHCCRKTLSDLIAMGFDRDEVEKLPEDDSGPWDDQRTQSRWRGDEYQEYRRPPGMREVTLCEEYVLLDRDDDGIAERWQFFRVGDVILGEQEVEDQPFVVWTPYPRAHRLVGNSQAEKAMMSQRLNSVLLRQSLDGTYLANQPRVWLAQESIGDTTLDDLMTPGDGVVVRGKGTTPPQAFGSSFDITKSLGMLEYVNGMRESRTGVTRLNQGLDEDTLNKTASGQAQLLARGDQLLEYQARNFAEAMGRLFAKKLKLMARTGDPVAMKIGGSYKRVDPSTWNTDMHVVVHVGLGSGRKEQRIVYRTAVAQQQAEALQAGLPIVTPKNLYRNGVGYIRDTNLGNPDDYWTDPDTVSAPAQKTDAATIEAQGKAQLAQQQAQQAHEQAMARLQLQQQEQQATAQLKAQANDADLQAKRERAALDSELARAKAEEEARLAQQRADREYALSIERMDREFALKREANVQAAVDNGLPNLRPGGDLSE